MELHHRTLLGLQPEALRDRLNGSANTANAIAAAAPPVAVGFHPVRREVGNVRSQGEGMISAI